MPELFAPDTEGTCAITNTGKFNLADVREFTKDLMAHRPDQDHDDGPYESACVDTIV